MMKADACRPQVLIVEDCRDLNEILGQVFEGAGYSVLSAHTVEDALRLFRTGAEPQVLILDYWMPGADGLCLLERLHTELNLEIPTILVSGLPRQRAGYFPEIRFQFLKPFDLEELEDAVEVVVQMEGGLKRVRDNFTTPLPSDESSLTLSKFF